MPAADVAILHQDKRLLWRASMMQCNDAVTSVKSHPGAFHLLVAHSDYFVPRPVHIVAAFCSQLALQESDQRDATLQINFSKPDDIYECHKHRTSFLYDVP